MAKVILKLYRPSSTPWNKGTRESLMEVSEGLIDLSWGYRSSSGGLWGGKAKFFVTKNTPAYDILKTGVSGSYEIQWIPTLPADRILDNYRDYKSNFLLSFGTTENIVINIESGQASGLVCSMDLKGAAQHFEKILVDKPPRKDTLTPIYELVEQIFESTITNNGLVRSFKVSQVGSSGREYYFNEPELTLGRIMETLQEKVGGKNLWGWGIRPKSGLTYGLADLGEAYFEPFTGADELVPGNKKQTWFLPRSRIISSKIRRRDSDIKNIIYVRTDKTVTGDDEFFIQGTARNEFSISRFGERELVVYDSSILNQEDANFVAAVICETKSNPMDEVEIVAVIDLDGGNQDNSDEGKFSGLVQTGLRNGASVILVESGLRPATQGGNLGCSFDGGGAGVAASCLKIDTSTQAPNDRAAYPNLKTAGNLASGQEITYVIQGKHPSGDCPDDDIAIMELDRQVCLGWEYQSAENFKLRIKYHNGSAWQAPSATLSAVPVSWTALQAEHTIFLTLQYGTTGVTNVIVNVGTASATTQLLNIAFSATSLLGTVDPDLILLNAWEGTGGGGVANPEQSRDFELSGFSGYTSDTSANYGNVNLANLMTDTKNATPPFNMGTVRVLGLNLGVINPDNSNKCLVRYRPARVSGNLIQDGSFEALLLKNANIFGGQSKSVVALDQPGRGVDGTEERTYTYPMGYKYTNTEIAAERSQLAHHTMYCATYNVLSHTAGKIELGVINNHPVDGLVGGVVELQTEVGTNLRTEFELDLSDIPVSAGAFTRELFPQLGNLTRNGDCQWSISDLQVRPIGGGTRDSAGEILESAGWANWKVDGDGSKHGEGLINIVGIPMTTGPGAGDTVKIYDPSYGPHTSPPTTARSVSFEFGGSASYDPAIGGTVAASANNLVDSINGLSSGAEFTGLVARIGTGIGDDEGTSTVVLYSILPGTAGNNTDLVGNFYINVTGTITGYASRIVVSGITGGGVQEGWTQVGWKNGADGKTAARIIIPDVAPIGVVYEVFFYQENIVENLRRYQATFQAKGDSIGLVGSGDAGGLIGVLGAASKGSSTDLVTETPTLTTSWEQYKIEFWGNENGRFSIGVWNVLNRGKTVHIDQLTVNEIPSPGEPKSGYFATIQKGVDNLSAFGAIEASPRYTPDLLGSGPEGRTVGGAIEIVPRQVEVSYQSEHSPLLVKIKGSVQGDAVTSTVEDMKERINALDDSVRGS